MNPLHGSAYAFWSGVGNDLPIYVLGGLPLIFASYRKGKCHVHGCWRIGHYIVGTYKVCRKHHPDLPDTILAEHIQLAHNQSKKGVDHELETR